MLVYYFIIALYTSLLLLSNVENRNHVLCKLCNRYYNLCNMLSKFETLLAHESGKSVHAKAHVAWLAIQKNTRDVEV